MQSHAGVAQVVFDAAKRRFRGHVHLNTGGHARVLQVSAPGHPCWSHRRIKAALIASAATQEEARHAGF